MTTYTMEEDIAASYALASAGDGAITADSVNEFLESEVVPLSDLRERRRKLAEAQGKADDIKSRICNSVNADTSRALHERIMDLRDSDRELYDYIWRLRSLKYGIWCTQCEQMKQIGGRDPENVKRDVEAEARGEPPEHHAVKKHVQLSQNNKMLPLLTGAEKTQIEQRHGNVVLTSANSHAPRIADRAKSMSRRSLPLFPIHSERLLWPIQTSKFANQKQNRGLRMIPNRWRVQKCSILSRRRFSKVWINVSRRLLSSVIRLVSS